MPTLRRIQPPPPVDNQIPVVTSQPGFSAMLQLKERISKKSIPKLVKAQHLLVFFITFIWYFYRLFTSLASQRHVRLPTRFSFVTLLTVLDCLCCVCSTRRCFIVRKWFGILTKTNSASDGRDNSFDATSHTELSPCQTQPLPQQPQVILIFNLIELL